MLKILILIFQIQGMSIDEALKQLLFVKRAGAVHVREVRNQNLLPD